MVRECFWEFGPQFLLMTLLMGTDAGVYRADELPFNSHDLEQVLECGRVRGIRWFDHTEGIFVAADSGLYRSTDGGHAWTDLHVPGDGEVWSVLATADGALYAGTNDPYLYRSLDGGKTWMELSGFRELPSRGYWESPADAHRARLRTLESPPGQPKQLVAGIEVGGAHVSDDQGATWRDCRTDSPDDIHQVVALSHDVYLAATGYFDLDLEHLGQGHALAEGGLYRTTDAGASWTRLDRGNEHAYIRGVLVSDGLLCFCGATTPPPEWRSEGIDAALFESTNLGRTFERVPYPGGPDELLEAWTVVDGRAVGGASWYGPSDPPDHRGRIIRRDDGEYHTAGRVPGNVSALETLPE